MSNGQLETRLRRAEQRVTTLAIALALAVAAIAWLFYRPAGPLRATSLEMVDSKGNTVALLGSMGGRTGLFLVDKKSVPRVSLFHADDADGMYIDDGEGVTRIGVAQFTHGGGGVALHGPGSQGAAVLYYKTAGSLRFFDAEGNVVREVSVTDGEEP